jgi:hypothetical protein
MITRTLPLTLLWVACLWLPKVEAGTATYGAQSAAGVNIVQNGAFDSPNGTGVPGWTYPGYLWVPGYPPGADGGPFVGVNGYMSQVLPTQPGQSYLLQFSIRATMPGIIQGGPYGISVSWGSRDPLRYNLTSDFEHWVPVQALLTAASTETLLSFTQPYGAWPYLDAVSVTAIPEPGTLSLLVLGLGLVATSRSLPVKGRNS